MDEVIEYSRVSLQICVLSRLQSILIALGNNYH